METRNQRLFQSKLSTQYVIIVLLLITSALLLISIYAVYGRSDIPLMKQEEESTFDPQYAANKANNLKREAEERAVPTLNLEPRRFNEENSSFQDSAARYVAMYENDSPITLNKALATNSETTEKTKAQQLEEELLQKLYTRKAEALLNALNSTTTLNLDDKRDRYQEAAQSYGNSHNLKTPLREQYLTDAARKLQAFQGTERESNAHNLSVAVGGGGAAAAGFGPAGISSLGGGSAGIGAPSVGAPSIHGDSSFGGNASVNRNLHTLTAYDALANTNTLLNTKVENVLSPFLIRQGTVIPCILLTGINSDIPGQVQAQVIEDVYDTPYGNYVLIPKGSKVIGQYASSVMMGAERLMLGFNRIIFPDGKALNLGSMAGSSMDGYAGFDAEVDNHMWRLFSNAILLGGVTAGVSLAVDDPRDSDGNLTVNGALSQALGQSIGRVMTNVIERNLAVSPTLKVQPGFNFNVTMTKDIYFDNEYRAYR